MVIERIIENIKEDKVCILLSFVGRLGRREGGFALRVENRGIVHNATKNRTNVFNKKIIKINVINRISIN